ncbi:universal stress protein [Herbidospora mongoliensis]|uniref:universal stress protein n=1 Tax=Herbidospora mongoliensis TaxID=688067 RepID=UPI001FE21079|nr:universal stress protein [Herbidospora mongoliensis]
MRALDWAIGEAEMRKVPLTVAHAWHWPYGEASDEAEDHLRRAADHVLWHGVSCARATSAVADVRSELWRGTAGDHLVALPGAADLVVVGSRGLSPVALGDSGLGGLSPRRSRGVSGAGGARSRADTGSGQPRSGDRGGWTAPLAAERGRCSTSRSPKRRPGGFRCSRCGAACPLCRSGPRCRSCPI